MKEICVGLIGLGTVGAGVAKILLQQADYLETKLGARIKLKKIADVDLKRDRGVAIPAALMISDPNEILNDPEIPIVIELIGGIEQAKNIILQAFSKGKHVVTANKALLATHGAELCHAANAAGVDLLFEGSVAGGIPIIRTLKEGLASNHIHYICGILNGTCNYILTKMTEGQGDFQEVLKEAQTLGYAESDPTLDVEAHDSAHKLAILLALSQGTYVNLSDIHTEGITGITPLDIQFAQELGYRIKLLGIIKATENEVEARVHPTMIPEGHILSSVNGAFNALQIVGSSVGSILLYGLGAGMMPTASAVVGDVMELARNVMKGVSQRVPDLAFQPQYVKYKKIRPIEALVSAYYFRFTALDRPGVLSRISGILGEHDISLASVIQKGRQAGQAVPVVMMTHKAHEADVRNALKRLNQLEMLPEKTVMIRVEQRENADTVTGGEW